MKEFETVEAFVAQSKTAATIDELSAHFQQAISRFGFDSFVLSRCVEQEGAGEDVLAGGRFPRIWHDHFVRENYFFGRREDECCVGGQLLPFTWGPTTISGRSTDSKRTLFSDASEAGLSHGVSVPIHVSGRPSAVGSVAGSFVDIDPSVVSAVHLMIMYLYNAAVELYDDSASASPADRGMLGRVKTLREASTID